MPTFHTLIFDLDGTLIHSAPDLQLASNQALKAIGRNPLDLATIISFIGNGVETLVLRCLEATGGTDAAQHKKVLAHFLEVYAQNMTTHTRPYPGVVPALEQFRASGMRLGICTNKPTDPAQQICERLDIAKYFDVITGAEPDVAKKPDPASLLRSIARLDAQPADTLYVGDSSIDFYTAQNASVPFRLFSAGYLNVTLPDVKDTDRFADWSEHGIAMP